MDETRPSDLEMQVLSVLWERGTATVRDVLESLPDGKDRAYTTVLSVMQVMEKKGLLTHQRDGNRNVYMPLVRQRKVVSGMLREMVRNVFGGRPSTAMQYLLSETEISDDELARLSSMIDRARKDAREGDSK